MAGNFSTSLEKYSNQRLRLTQPLSVRLDSIKSSVCVFLFYVFLFLFLFSFFFFFFFCMRNWRQRLLFMYYAWTVAKIFDFSVLFSASVGLVHCSRDPQTLLFSYFFIKNGSHDTIHRFKNYFATVFSVSVFSFSKNKFNPNTLLEMILFVFCWLMQSCVRIYIYFGYKFFKLVMQTCN